MRPTNFEPPSKKELGIAFGLDGDPMGFHDNCKIGPLRRPGGEEGFDLFLASLWLYGDKAIGVPSDASDIPGPLPPTKWRARVPGGGSSSELLEEEDDDDEEEDGTLSEGAR